MNMRKLVILLLAITILTSGCVYSNNTTDVGFTNSTQYNRTVNLTTNDLTGVGNAYACLNANGILYRSALACV